MTIRKKIILFIVFAFTITGFVYSYHDITGTKAELEEALIKRGQTLNLFLARSVRSSVASENLDLIQETSSIIHSEDIDLIQVFSPLWEPIDSFPKERLRELPKEALIRFESAQADVYYAGDKSYDFYRPIFLKTEKYEIIIGYARVVLSTEPMKEAIKNNIYRNVLFTILFIFAGSILLYFMLGFIIKPIERISNAVKKIRDGDYSSRVIWNSEDELGMLVEILNSMTETVEKQTLELKAKKEEAEKQRGYIQHIINGIADPIIVIDGNYNIIFSNESSLRFHYGNVSDKIEKCYQLSHHRNTPCENGFHRCPLNEVIRTKKPVIVIHTHYDKAMERSFEIVASPIFNDSGDVVQVVEACRDITERQMLEEKDREIERKSAEILRMRSLATLSAGVAHHFNNILTPILGYAELLKEETGSEHKWHEYFEIMEKMAIRGAKITRELTRYVHREIGSQASIISLKDIIGHALNVLEDEFGKDITFMEDIDHDLWQINGDKEQMREVIVELCLNARDAMPDGGVLSITAKNISLVEKEAVRLFGGQEGRYVYVSVRDSGTGITEENTKRIFDPFFTTKDVKNGSGLGLPIVYGIIKNHSGYITVQSEVSRGSTFDIYIPAYEIETSNKAYLTTSSD